MHKTQEVYCLAKAAYAQSIKEASERYGEIEHIANEDFDKYHDLCDVIDAEVGTQTFFDLLWQAETEVIKWGRDQVRMLEEYKPHRKEIEDVFEMAVEKQPRPRVRKQILELSLRLGV